MLWINLIIVWKLQNGIIKKLYPGFGNYTVAINENELILKKYMLKYLGVKEHICNIFSKGSENTMCAYKERWHDKANVAKC